MLLIKCIFIIELLKEKKYYLKFIFSVLKNCNEYYQSTEIYFIQVHEYIINCFLLSWYTSNVNICNIKNKLYFMYFINLLLHLKRLTTNR